MASLATQSTSASNPSGGEVGVRAGARLFPIPWSASKGPLAGAAGTVVVATAAVTFVSFDFLLDGAGRAGLAFSSGSCPVSLPVSLEEGSASARAAGADASRTTRAMVTGGGAFRRGEGVVVVAAAPVMGLRAAATGGGTARAAGLSSPSGLGAVLDDACGVEDDGTRPLPINVFPGEGAAAIVSTCVPGRGFLPADAGLVAVLAAGVGLLSAGEVFLSAGELLFAVGAGFLSGGAVGMRVGSGLALVAARVGAVVLVIACPSATLFAAAFSAVFFLEEVILRVAIYVFSLCVGR